MQKNLLIDITCPHKYGCCLFYVFCYNFRIICFIAGVAFAQDDDVSDDINDVDGEEASVLSEDDPEEETVTASADADTTILFTKPIHQSLSTLGKYSNLLNPQTLKFVFWSENPQWVD